MDGRQLPLYESIDQAIDARVRGGVLPLTRAAADPIVRRGLVTNSKGWTWASDKFLTSPPLFQMMSSKFACLLNALICQYRSPWVTWGFLGIPYFYRRNRTLSRHKGGNFRRWAPSSSRRRRRNRAMVIGEAFLILKIWILLGSMMLSQLSLAADVPGSSDLPEVKRPSGSEIIRYAEGTQTAIRFPLERVERVNNRLVIDNELDIEGHVIDITYELGPGEDYAIYMNTLESGLRQTGAEILFSCESRGCGVRGSGPTRYLRFVNSMVPMVSRSISRLNSPARLHAIYRLTALNGKPSPVCSCPTGCAGGRAVWISRCPDFVG